MEPTFNKQMLSKKVILLLMNGEQLPGIMMTIIRFVMPSKDHLVKKLTLLYWEVAEKFGPDGKLLPEMILVCNFLRNDLNHPNEYIRGSTLRYLCKMKEIEILEPLVPSIRNNLEHRHSYVRRNAVLAIYTVFRNFDTVIPDAPELIFHLLSSEGDAGCKRNAFLMLFSTAQEKAVEYLNTILDQVANLPDILQMIVVELIRKVCRKNPAERTKYITCIYSLLNSSSPSVQFQTASTWVALSSGPTAMKAAASAFIQLLVNQSDNNVKMIVLDRLLDIKQRHPKVLEELLMDVLRALASPNMDIRQKTLDIVMDLVNPKNVDEVIQTLKKEINRTQSNEMEKGAEYRHVLIQSIHTCAVKFPEVASNVVHTLMDFLGDTNVSSAVDVILFVREVVETYPDLRQSIVRKLLSCLNQIKSSKVFRASLWIIGEYSDTKEDIDMALTAIKESLGEPTFLDTTEAEQTPTPSTPAPSQNRLVLPDGTYATQSALIETPEAAKKTKVVSHLRALLLGGDYFLGCVVTSTMTKLVLKLQKHDVDQGIKNSLTAEAMLIATSLLRLGKSDSVATQIDADSYDKICLCIRVLAKPNSAIEKIYLQQCRQAYQDLLKEAIRNKPSSKKEAEISIQADDLIKIRQLRGKSGGQDDIEEQDEGDLHLAMGNSQKDSDSTSRLNRIIQLTGLSDAIYAEAYVNVHQYDILLEVIVLNQTNDTLQNVTLELATLGDLKLVERPQSYNFGPHEQKTIKANIKISSTETGIIFGNIVYDVAGSTSSDRNCVILNDIHIDIMDYIAPAHCTEASFRSMWAEFEWENKVAVSTHFNDVNKFLEHILKCTNMNCLTPPSALSGECGFLSANLYARSIFGEDALANISVEKQEDGKITGYIRIRSKTQGIALSLGDRITLKQHG